jgi:hypothetical protein
VTSTRCTCGKRDRWRVWVHRGYYVVDGTRSTQWFPYTTWGLTLVESARSSLSCGDCGARWRTKAKYVEAIYREQLIADAAYEYEMLGDELEVAERRARDVWSGADLSAFH